MYKLNFKKRVWVVKQILNGMPINEVARIQKVSRISVFKIMQKYKEFSWDGLKDYKTGRPETVLGSNATIIICDIRKRYGYGPCRIGNLLKRKGFGISHRQIEKVLIRNDLVEPNIRKQKPRKWVRYELPNPNDLWHTDWTYCPFTDMNLSVYLDDRTRKVTANSLCKHATAKNSIAILRSGIAENGKPKAVMTDHGSQFYANHPNAKQENTEFRKTLNILGIKHCLARVNRPQTNGKVERFFLTYKTEFITGTFKNINDFIKFYNEERPHMSLNYKTPNEVWEEYKC